MSKKEIPYIIAVDFDNTLAESDYPFIKSANRPLIDWLNQKRKEGCIVILWTNRQGRQLQYACDWCVENGVELDYINQNAPEAIEKYGSDSRKIFADMYIDDRNADKDLFDLPYKEVR